jgi:hypothetical protein
MGPSHQRGKEHQLTTAHRHSFLANLLERLNYQDDVQEAAEQLLVSASVQLDMSIQSFPNLGNTTMEFFRYAIKRVIFRLVNCAHLTPKCLNPLGVGFGRVPICFEQLFFLLADGLDHCLTASCRF